MYERAQEGLHVDANQWVNLQRLYDPSEMPDTPPSPTAHRMADAEPVPRLVEIHDDVDVTDSSMNAPTDQQLIDFVIRETRLIDQHRFEEWLDLFAEDGFYWMPLEWGQTDRG